MKLLEIDHLTTQFKTEQGMVSAVRDVSYSVNKGEILGVVGESGSGKSVGILSVLGLLASNGKVTEGRIMFDGKDISTTKLKTKKENKEHEILMQNIRGNEIGMIFQDPMTFLNPILKIGTQITEAILVHNKDCSKKEAKKRAIKLMSEVGIPSPEKRFNQYPFEFSGGMRQRIIIAIALSCNPKLLIADEPTTALDVTVQAQILDLLKDITKGSETAIIMISHDLGVVATLCERINIMYGGKIVEEGTTNEIFYEPKHPYTLGLLRSINNVDDEKKPLIPIAGTPPDLINLPKGCAFVSRCTNAMNVCKEYTPSPTSFTETHSCSCWLLSKRGDKHE